MRFSVVIAAYNYGRYLGQCLQSLREQTRTPDQVVVVDDGSSDETWAVVRRFPEVVYERQANAGKAQAFNTALALATGDVICHLDADDWWMPRKLEVVEAYLERWPEAGGLVHRVQYVDDGGRPIPEPGPGGTFGRRDLRDVLIDSMVFPPREPRTFGGSNTCVVRREVIAPYVPLPPKLGLAVDGFLIFAAATRGLLCLEEVLSVYRKHEGSSFRGSALADQVRMMEWLAAHPEFLSACGRKEKKLASMKVWDYQAYYSVATGAERLRGSWAALRALASLARMDIGFNAAYALLPFACLAPNVLRGRRTAVVARLNAAAGRLTRRPAAPGRPSDEADPPPRRQGSSR